MCCLQGAALGEDEQDRPQALQRSNSLSPGPTKGYQGLEQTRRSLAAVRQLLIGQQLSDIS